MMTDLVTLAILFGWAAMLGQRSAPRAALVAGTVGFAVAGGLHVYSFPLWPWPWDPAFIVGQATATAAAIFAAYPVGRVLRWMGRLVGAPART